MLKARYVFCAGCRSLALFGSILLSARFLFAEFLAVSAPAVVAFLVLGTAVLTRLWPNLTFRALLVFIPVIFGLGRAGLFSANEPDAVLAAAFVITISFREVYGLQSLLSNRLPDPEYAAGITGFFVVIADALATCGFVSFLFWFLRIGIIGSELKRAIYQPIFGFSDPLYPITNTFVWLIGWVYFRTLITELGFGALSSARRKAGDGASDHSSIVTSFTCNPIIQTWALCALGFFLLQVYLNVPDGFPYDPSFLVPTSMFNDPHSMGSVCSSLGVGFLAALQPGRLWRTLSAVLLAAGLLILVGISYSRAAWFSASFSLVAVMLWRWRRFALGTGLLLLLAIGYVFLRSDRLLSLNHPYLTRVVQFVRLDRLSSHNEARIEVYRRAPRMIAAHPLVGHGPGSTRYSSIAFVLPSDLWGPDFMHNAVIQMAVEEGIPAAALLTTLLLAPLIMAAVYWRLLIADSSARGFAVALFTYLVTQITANSLNVYLEQQFFCWSLVGGLVLRLRTLTAAISTATG